jgi:SNF2 family DNA or RNA helicase
MSMIEGVVSLDFSRCRLPPFAHQRVGIKAIVSHQFFALFDEMGSGKSKQTIDAACMMYVDDIIDRMIIVAPACVKSVWYDPDLSELKKHLWADLPVIVQEQSTRRRTWNHGPETVDGKPVTNRFPIIITNYELIRSGRNWLDTLLACCTPKTLLVLDEATAVKNWKSLQTGACRQLRKKCGRVLLLNGTPLANSPLDMFAQGNLMSPDILQCVYITHFRARYELRTPVKRHNGSVMIDPYGKPIMQNAGWTNLDDLAKRFAPHVLRRMKADTLDLPAKLPPTSITVPMTTSWPHYKAMRDQMVIWLSESSVATAQTAAVKVMRLAQITSGFVGGVEDASIGEPDRLWDMEVEDRDGVSGQQSNASDRTNHGQDSGARDTDQVIREVGREKLDAFLDWLALRLEEDPNLKLLVQARFRPEIARLTTELRAKYPFDIGEIIGGQKRQARTDALRLMDPRTAPAGPAIVTMSSAGSLGLNLTAAHTVARLSRDYSLWLWLQGEDRVHRPGQTSPVSYTDFVCRTPKGGKTVDHIILEALMAKQDVANLTADGWRAKLVEE